MTFTKLLLCCLVLFPCLADACPLGAGEEALTFTRVMRNFGRNIAGADRAARKGELAPGEVTEAELRAAVVGLKVAGSCADTVATDRTGALYPRKAAELSG